MNWKVVEDKDRDSKKFMQTMIKRKGEGRVVMTWIVFTHFCTSFMILQNGGWVGLKTSKIISLHLGTESKILIGMDHWKKKKLLVGLSRLNFKNI
jgi:hypothetical protein